MLRGFLYKEEVDVSSMYELVSHTSNQVEELGKGHESEDSCKE
jgi:hypothetical protein